MAKINFSLILFLVVAAAASRAEAALHEAMNARELHSVFQAATPGEVDADAYELAAIRYERVVPRSKRAGTDVPHHDAAVSVTTFGRKYHMKLARNTALLHPEATFSWLTEETNTTVVAASVRDEFPALARCHYQVVDESKRVHGAVSDCLGEFRGFFVPKDDEEDGGAETHVFEVHPVPERLSQGLSKRSGPSEHPEKLHIVRRVALAEFSSKMAAMADDLGLKEKVAEAEEKAEEKVRTKRTMVAGTDYKSCGKPPLDIETKLYLDHKGYLTLAMEKKYNNPHILNAILLVIMNGINSIFHHPSLGREVNFIVKTIDISTSASKDGFTHSGERTEQLIAFCKHNKEEVAKAPADMKWDLALLFTGHDIWAMSGGKKSYATMGLSGVKSICTAWACVTGEIGVKSSSGDYYPSTGFMAIYVMGHEIAHNLGMSHDGKDDSASCPTNGYVMSGSRGTSGETFWSSCSRHVICSIGPECLNNHAEPMAAYDHMMRYHNEPGRVWTPAQQCEHLTGEKGSYMYATEANMDKICDVTIVCKGSGFFGEKYSGPALAGTYCGPGKYCHWNECVPDSESAGGDGGGGNGGASGPKWSPWMTPKSAQCQFGCIEGSIGAIKRERICLKDSGRAYVGGSSPDCLGDSVKTERCKPDDPKGPSCSIDIREQDYLNSMCRNWNNDPSVQFSYRIQNVGFRPPHNTASTDPNADDSRACTIYCRKDGASGYASPVSALGRLGRMKEAYVPDGTHCHSEGGHDYYCFDHRCVSTGRGARNSQRAEVSIPNGATDAVDRYFSLDGNGNPVSVDAEAGKEAASEEIDLDEGVEELPIGPGHPL